MMELDALTAIFEVTNPIFANMMDLKRKGYTLEEIAHAYGYKFEKEDPEEVKDDRTLEQKYWDCQRLIDQYHRDSDMDKRLIKFWQNRYYEAVEKAKKAENVNSNNLRLTQDYDIQEIIQLKNELAIEKIKAKERQRYLEAYQKLYVEECMKNRKKEEGLSEDDYISCIRRYNEKDIENTQN